MKSNLQATQGILSILAIVCLAAGWFKIFPDNINYLLSARLFYILIGVSFIVQGRMLMHTKFMYPMYAAAGLCIIGAFLPMDSSLNIIKTIGLLGGVVISFVSRSQNR
ncbi:MAG: hypothetical protein J6O88_16990 [Chryseobacterium sp.]|uniref:hypothetical protein n=1 Tax=Chryseobacterium sp. TaxID=1871047 RepID=UPI001B15A5E2|nr:hypothetical protein [Chryseobacterium sp.]MBO6186357.1 hypothetical protein [Chryseobacterium sp.]